MAKLNFYIEFDFLLSFLKLRPSVFEVDEIENADFIDKIKLWLDFFQLLSNHCNLISDKNSDNFIQGAEQNNEVGKLLRILIKKTQIQYFYFQNQKNIVNQLNIITGTSASAKMKYFKKSSFY